MSPARLEGGERLWSVEDNEVLGATHALIGFASGVYLAHTVHGSPLETLALGALCAVSALLPDVDHPNSVIRGRMHLAGDIAFGWLRHRGITHTITAVVLIAWITAMITPSRQIATTITIGYASHLLADLITPQGVPLFGPLTWKRIRLPLITTGSLIEHALALALVAISFWIIYH